MTQASPQVPWCRPAPKKTHTKLLAAEKQEAKLFARKDGRTYPDLVDNMKVARKRQ